jgi:hypothetical protein
VRESCDSDLSDAAFAVIEPILASRANHKSDRPKEENGHLDQVEVSAFSTSGSFRTLAAMIV